MDMTKNRIPDSVHTIHLTAICGTGMGALACMLKDLGLEVTGSDASIYPPMSHFLENKHVRVLDGFRQENIAYQPDLVVVGNAVSRDNPEVRAIEEMGLHFCSMPQALNHFVAADKKTLLISGTHGKTTTSSILAWILFEAGLDPSFMIGGLLTNFDSNYRLGTGDYIVIEGDEYDTAFFDKAAKFFHYQPSVTVLTSVEFDHADIFTDLAHVKKTFGVFIHGLPQKSTLMAFDGDANVADLIHNEKIRIEKYGGQTQSDWTLGSVDFHAPWTSFEVIKKGKHFGKFKTKLYGRHNLFNILADVAVADRLGIPVAAIAKALETFQGIKRRQEIRGQKRQITVMDDFAHHPTAVRETVAAVKTSFPQNRLIAVFEPRTNSSMRLVFQDIYPLCFDEADLICIRKPPLLKKIPLAERFSSEKLVDDLNRRGKQARFFEDTDAILQFLSLQAEAGDIILIMSNGGFDNIHQRLLDIL